MTNPREPVVANDRVYTMRELNQRTAEVLRQINEDGRPAVITRHGRFVALITPLADRDIEAALLDQILESTGSREQLIGHRPLDTARTTSEVAEELGLTLPDYPQRRID
ncbi:type II toxin-antitoxin system Phd/YefM family antitoxin [Micromonospora sp. LOL_014]|uniref:type II toxin-antitoxin system Phd/YefM family antitoxin n=1 Tax=Micromonospora sp. LOL_014 TaxID=3345415 RepID=UPI003A8ACA82